MNLRNAKLSVAHGRNVLCTTLALAMAAAPLPVLAAGPAEGESEAPAEATSAEVGGSVALLKFDGDKSVGDGLREQISYAFEGAGYTVTRVKRSGEEAAKKNKCDLAEDSCLEKIGAYLNKNARTPFDFYIVGEGATPGSEATITVYDINAKKKVRDFVYTGSNDDVLLPYTLPPALARATAEYQVPPPAMSEEEKKIIAELDEPEKTPEEIAAEQKALEDAALAGRNAFDANLDAGEQEVDLKKDFETYCRKGPREDKVSTDLEGEEVVERDLRPVCKRGAFFGYWQPKAYAVLGLTAAGLVGTGLMYGLALSARGEWSTAKDALDAASLDGNNPMEASEYGALATDVTTAAFKVRRRAIVGDALLGTTLVFGGLLGIIIWQERQQAKDFIKSEKELRAIGNLNVSPVVGRGQYGMGASFSF